MNEHILFYKKQIHSLIHLIPDIEKQDNYVLSKCFEYFTCIKLTDEFQREFHAYSYIKPHIKEKLNLTNVDVGIDATDLTTTLVQSKLYTDAISWRCLATFLAHQTDVDDNGIPYVKWKKMILYRNSESTLSNKIPLSQKRILVDKHIPRNDFIQALKIIQSQSFTNENIKERIQKIILRPYQVDCIELLEQSDRENKNVVISLPCGMGKTVTVLNYIKNLKNKKILILVPKCQLAEQWYNQFKIKKNIYIVDKDHNNLEENKYQYIICVYNSFHKISHLKFDKIFIDEAHHVRLPDIYECKEKNEAEEINEEEKDEINNEEKDRKEEYNEEEIIDNEEDDRKEEDNEEDNESYIHEISLLKKTYTNIVELSATIDKDENALNYVYDLRQGIDDGYLTDYQIVVPIFSNKPDDATFVKYLYKNGVNHCIIFAKNQTEGKKFNDLLNKFVPKCSDYIDCNTTKKKRNEILNKFEMGTIRFLVNIRVLSEGYDSLIATSCVFLHMNSNDVFIVQAVGRILRLHPEKKFSTIYLPALIDDDTYNVTRLLKILSNNDKLMKEIMVTKKLGSYINLVIEDENDNDEEDDENDEEKKINKTEEEILRYNIIYDSLGKCVNNIEIWMLKFEECKDFIDRYNRRPTQHSKNIKEHKLGEWLSIQITNIKTRKQIMKEDKVYNIWLEFMSSEKYKKFFLNNEESWINTFYKVKEFIDLNNKRPTNKSKDEKQKKLSKWIETQIVTFKKRQYIMKNDRIYNIWKIFIESDKYKNYFLTYEELWMNMFSQVKDFINTNNKRPLNGSKDEKENKLSVWMEPK